MFIQSQQSLSQSVSRVLSLLQFSQKLAMNYGTAKFVASKYGKHPLLVWPLSGDDSIVYQFTHKENRRYDCLDCKLLRRTEKRDNTEKRGNKMVPTVRVDEGWLGS